MWCVPGGHGPEHAHALSMRGSTRSCASYAGTGGSGRPRDETPPTAADVIALPELSGHTKVPKSWAYSTRKRTDTLLSSTTLCRKYHLSAEILPQNW
jgi:hypothetical protein